MTDTEKLLRPWVLFAGCVLVIVILNWAEEILVPIALAVLLTFVLTPVVKVLQRAIGRVPAVLVTVALVFSALGLAGWGLAAQISQLATDLDGYRDNIRQKVADVREAGRGGSVEKVQETLEEIKGEMERTQASKGTPAAPVVVEQQSDAESWGPTWLAPVVAPLGTAGLVSALVIFMLLEREEWRGRLLGLFGHGHLAVTTKALEEAGKRVSRQLLMQTLVNLIYGSLVAAGLFFLDVPYPFLWGALGAALRFIPYVGPVIAAGAPILVSLAALPGWTEPVKVMALFLVLELFTNLVLETVLWAEAAGVSSVALLIAVAFWTWLWGPLGLLMATPLTVCVVVLGKHVPGLEFLSTLMADKPALAADITYYQRLLARDQSEAADLIERHVKAEPPDTVYDALLLPALTYAERDRLEGRLSTDEEVAVLEATRELMGDAALMGRVERMVGRSAEPAIEHAAPIPLPQPVMAGRVLGVASGGLGDELALRMLGELLAGANISIEVGAARQMAFEIVAEVERQGVTAVCIADLPPSQPSKTRYLVRKLRASSPSLAILVGRWAPPELAEDGSAPALTEAGATQVSSKLLDTRDEILRRCTPSAAREAAGTTAA